MTEQLSEQRLSDIERLRFDGLSVSTALDIIGVVSEVRRLRAENERLLDAIRRIAVLPLSRYPECFNIAKRALDGSPIATPP